MKQFQGDQSGRLREWVGYSFWACCFYCTFPKSNHFSFDGFSFRFEWIFPLYISYRSPGQFSIGSQQSSNRFTPTLPKKRKTKPTHTHSVQSVRYRKTEILRESWKAWENEWDSLSVCFFSALTLTFLTCKFLSFIWWDATSYETKWK